MRIELDKQYRIAATDPMFSDWFNVVAVAKQERNGVYEMHANNAFIYCTERQLRSVRKPTKKRKGNAKCCNK